MPHKEITKRAIKGKVFFIYFFGYVFKGVILTKVSFFDSEIPRVLTTIFFDQDRQHIR